MKKKFYCKIILMSLLMAGGFGVASFAHADYFAEGTVLSTNLLAGKSDVAQVTFFHVNMSIPANTNSYVQFSQNGTLWQSSSLVQGGWDTLLDGDNTLDVRMLDYKTANFYYRVKLTTGDASVAPTLNQAEVEYADLYIPAQFPAEGTVLSTNLLAGKSDVAQVTFFKADATIPASTTISVQFSKDGVVWYGDDGVQGGWYAMVDGANSIDIRPLNFATANFYYRAKLTTTDSNVGPVMANAEVDYSSTYVPSEFPAQGTLLSTDLLSGTGIVVGAEGGYSFVYDISLPAGTSATVQFSENGTSGWRNSNGTVGGVDALLNGSHLTWNTALDLNDFGWTTGTSFYYKMTFRTTDSSVSPILNQAGILAVESPAVWFNFNEGNGNTAGNDNPFGARGGGFLQPGSSGTNTTVTAMWNKNGKFGGGMEFDGTDDRLKVGNFKPSDPAKLVVSQFVNFQTLATAKPIFSQWGNSNNNILIKSDDVNSDELRVCVADSLTDNCANYAVTTDANFAMSRWYHVAVVYDGAQSDNASRLKIYIDGVQKTLTFSGTIPATLQNPLSTLEIGGDSDLGTYFNGRLDEIKTFNTTKSAAEIQILNNDDSSLDVGNDTSRNNNGTAVTGAAKDYCIPGDTARCDAPVGEWKMDEGFGTTTYDTSGNGNDGTLVNSPAWTQGKFGKALNFNGSSNYVRSSGGGNIGVGYSGTITFWAKGTGLAISNYRSSNSVGEGMVNVLSSGYLRYTVQSNSSSPWVYYFTTTIGANTNNWNFYALSVTVPASSGTLSGTLYVNGFSQILSTACTVNGAVQFGTIDIGAHRNYTYNTDYFNGQIDNVKVYNYRRTPAQIAWDYNRGKPVAEWRMDECSGSVIGDVSGNAKHGTLNLGASGQATAGTCTANANTPWWNGRTGKYNASLNFDGTDDYVGIGTAITGVNAVSLWIKPTSTTQSIIDLDGGTHKISMTNGTLTATGFNSLYVDGLLSGTVPDTSWHHIIAIANTAFNTTTGMTIGKISSAYFAGQIDNVKIFNYAPTPTQIKTEYNNGAVSFND